MNTGIKFSNLYDDALIFAVKQLMQTSNSESILEWNTSLLIHWIEYLISYVQLSTLCNALLLFNSHINCYVHELFITMLQFYTTNTKNEALTKLLQIYQTK
jgi:hypothetical protein